LFTYVRALLLFCILGGGGICLTGCTDDDLTNPDERYPDGLPIHLKTSDYNNQNTYYMLNDDEPSTVFFNNNERSFYVDQPIQMSIDNDLFFHLRFYSPRPLPNVSIWAKIDGYDEQFKLFFFDKLMPFQQFIMQIPLATQNMMAVTRSGKSIQIMANPHLTASNFTLEIECDAPYYKTLQDIKTHWRVWYSDYNLSGNWAYPLRVHHAREAVALALNMSYMYSTDEFAKALKEFGPLHSNAQKTEINKDALLKNILNFSGLRVGHCTWVYGLGGGNTFGLHGTIFYEHYPDDASITETIYHEFAHCIGYGHDGNMTYENTGPGWITLCHRVYTQLARDKKLPVYSARFLSTRRTATTKYDDEGGSYYSPKFIIEDPELDEIDGGLERGFDFLNTDWGEKENAPALSFKLDYNGAETGEKNFMPNGIYVYGDKLYVANQIRQANWSWDVYNLSSGKPVLEKRFTKWTNPDGKEQTIGEPMDILRSNGKIYLVCDKNGGNALFAFDADTYACTHKVNIGYGAVGLAAVKGTVYAYRGNVRAFPEHNLANGYIASSAALDSHTYNAMTADYNGNIYAVVYNSKKLIRLETKYQRAARLTAAAELTFEAKPLGAAWSADGRLFVSFEAAKNQTDMKFCEVDPKSGKIIKDYTTIGDITLQNPAKCLIRRNTLFVVDRVGGLCIYAIPMSELK
ncbi:MAG: hypothetical protein K2K43_02630, partial [Alistipes sp.]|nr:hypothetical protein [Alistipes sp.]